RRRRRSHLPGDEARVRRRTALLSQARRPKWRDGWMKVLILGGVAAGTKAAAKLKREMPDAQVTILTRGKDISYAGCGLPYYVGGAIASRAALVVNSPEQFSGLTGAKVLTGREAYKVEPEARAVWARSLDTGAEERYEYDELIIAVGASPSVPPLEGVGLKGIFTMR